MWSKMLLRSSLSVCLTKSSLISDSIWIINEELQTLVGSMEGFAAFSLSCATVNEHSSGFVDLKTSLWALGSFC